MEGRAEASVTGHMSVTGSPHRGVFGQEEGSPGINLKIYEKYDRVTELHSHKTFGRE
jgi:hypothetical protein